MPGRQRPRSGDIVIHQHAPKVYTIAALGSEPQISCSTLDEALKRARSFAMQARVAVWLATGESEFTLLAEA